MSTMSTTPATTIGKRKRTVTSYAEVDDLDGILDDTHGNAGPDLGADDGDESDNDDRTYSSRKVGANDLLG